MSDFTLSGDMEQTLLVSAVRYALGRHTYMPNLTCSVLSKHMDSFELLKMRYLPDSMEVKGK